MPHLTPLPVFDSTTQRREPTPPLEWLGNNAADAANFLQKDPLMQELMTEELLLGAPLLAASSGGAWDAATQAARFAGPAIGTAARTALGPLTSLQTMLDPSDTQSNEEEMYGPFLDAQQNVLDAYTYEGQTPAPEFVQRKALELLQESNPDYIKWLTQLSQLDELP